MQKYASIHKPKDADLKEKLLAGNGASQKRINCQGSRKWKMLTWAKFVFLSLSLLTLDIWHVHTHNICPLGICCVRTHINPLGIWCVCTQNISLGNTRDAWLQANRKSWDKTPVQCHAPAPPSVSTHHGSDRDQRGRDGSSLLLSFREWPEASLSQEKWLETEAQPEVRGVLWTPEVGVYPGMGTSNGDGSGHRAGNCPCDAVCGDDRVQFGLHLLC